MAQEILTELFLKGMVSEFAKTIVNELKPSLKGLRDEIQHIFDDGLMDYLEKQKEKFSHIKTVLHMENPVFIYDTYQPLSLSFKNETIKTNSVKDIFKERNCITLLGEAGSGKSTLVKHLFLNTIFENYRIPIIIQLRDLNDYSNGLNQFIKEKILNNKLSPNMKIVERLLENGMFLFFLDGYDEIKTSVKSKVIENLNQFISDYSENKYLVTSRPLSNIECLPAFYNYNVKNLTNIEIEAFIKREVDDSMFNKIMKSIKETSNKQILKFLKNPMLLSLFVLTFQSYPNIPQKIDVFYGRVIDVLFYKHDSWTKPGFDREMYSNLSQEEYISVLKRFCFLSYFEEKYEFETDYICQTLNTIKSKLTSIKFNNNDFIKDLEIGVCLWIEDSGKISFSHRSLQEYFAALYIRDLTNEQKKQVYTKMKNGSLKRLVETDWENFIVLCENMDELNYHKYFLLPLLKELYNKITQADKASKVETFITIFYVAFLGVEKIKDSGKLRVTYFRWSDDAALYFSCFKINARIRLIIQKCFDDEIVQKYLNDKYSSDLEEAAVYAEQNIVSPKRLINVRMDKKFFQLLNNEMTDKNIDDFIVFLDTKIKFIEDQISQSLEAENSFIDLI